MGLSIDGIEICLPKKILTNESLAAEFNVSTAEIFKKTGIKTRYIANIEQTASDLAFDAAENLFKSEKITKKEIDFLIYCSDCFDYIAPATSCILQNRLGLEKTIGCIDLPYGCSGYVYGLGIANGLLESKMATTVLFLTCDTSTKTLQSSNLEQRSLFSDVATANIITLNKSSNSNSFVFGTDGSGALDLYIENSGFRQPINETYKVDNELPFGQMIMDGSNIFTFALKVVPKLVNDTLTKNNLVLEDIDLFIFHQANGFILETLRRKLNIPLEKFYTNIENYGNTVASSIPLALYTAEKENKLKKGMKVLLAGFGVGNSWAATVINY